MPSAPKTVLISVHPRFADLILSGEKRIEFRRVWAKEPVDSLVLYATSPVMRIVGVVTIQKVVKQSASHLWELAKEHGGGLTRDELRKYFSGKLHGFGIQLGRVRKLKEPFVLTSSRAAFRPPQSFRYLTESELKIVQRHLTEAR